MYFNRGTLQILLEALGNARKFKWWGPRPSTKNVYREPWQTTHTYTYSHIQYIDGLAQNCRNSIANALELPKSCAKPSICILICVCIYLYILYHIWYSIYLIVACCGQTRLTGTCGTWSRQGIIRLNYLIHRDLNKMVDILQKTFSIAFWRWRMIEFQFKFHWCLFLSMLSVQLTKSQHWFSWWFKEEHAKKII